MQPDVPKPGSPADWLRHARNVTLWYYAILVIMRKYH